MGREGFTRIPNYKNKVERYLKRMGSCTIAPFRFVIKAEDLMSSIPNFSRESSCSLIFFPADSNSRAIVVGIVLLN